MAEQQSLSFLPINGVTRQFAFILSIRLSSFRGPEESAGFLKTLPNLFRSNLYGGQIALLSLFWLKILQKDTYPVSETLILKTAFLKWRVQLFTADAFLKWFSLVEVYKAQRPLARIRARTGLGESRRRQLRNSQSRVPVGTAALKLEPSLVPYICCFKSYVGVEGGCRWRFLV